MKNQRHAARQPARAAADELTVCGLRAAWALFACGRMTRLFVGKESNNPRLLELQSEARQAGIPIVEASAQELEKLAGKYHQQVAAHGTAPTADLPALLNDKRGVLLAVDGVTDTGNLGAILRIGRAFAAAAVIVPKRRSAALSGAAKASAGAVAHLPVLPVTNLARTLRQIQDAGWTVAGADEDGETMAFPPPPVCWVFGDEGEGLRLLSRRCCDFLVRIPTVAGEGGCLNVAAACAVCLAATRAAGGGYSPPSDTR